MTYVESFKPAPVARKVADARAAVDGEQIVPRSRCVDWLLDCLNAAKRQTVRAVVVQELGALPHSRNIRTADFERALDCVQLAVQVDEVFDHLELGDANGTAADGAATDE